jgi:hypothetical protein
MVATITAVALVAVFLWTRHRPDGGSLTPARERQVERTIRGTLVYADVGDDGAIGRLWIVDLEAGRAVPGPPTLRPDEIVAVGERGLGVRAGGSVYVVRGRSVDGSPELLAEGELAAWEPGGAGAVVVTRDPSARGRCPVLRLTRVDARSHAAAEVYRRPTCSTVTALATDGLSRPFVSLDGPTDAGVYELGYRTLHKVFAEYQLLSVSPVGDMLVGPPVETPTGSDGGPSPILRTLLVWQGVGGPTVIGSADNDLRAERFLAWSHDGHKAAVLGTLGRVRSIWVLKAIPGQGRRHPRRVAPELPANVVSVGAAFLGDSLIVAAAGKVYVVLPNGYRELELPEGAPPPSGPLLWLDD